VASIDASIPPQYDQSKGWLIQTVKNAKGVVIGGVITKNARDRYNVLIEDYCLQFREAYKVKLVPDAGIQEYEDKYKNTGKYQLYLIDAMHLEFMGRLSQWDKDNLAPDSAWQKIKAAISK
jgi:hypothetical protein